MNLPSLTKTFVSLLVFGCAAYAALLFRWTYQPCSDVTYNIDRLNHQQAFAWVLGVDMLAVLFLFTRSARVPMLSGLFGLIAFAVSFPSLILIAIGECGTAGWGLLPFFIAFVGGSMLVIASVLFWIVKAIKYLAGRGLIRRTIAVGGWRFETSDLLAAFTLAAVTVAMPLVLVNGNDWLGDVPLGLGFWARVALVSAVALVVAALLAIWRAAIRGPH